MSKKIDPDEVAAYVEAQIIPGFHQMLLGKNQAIVDAMKTSPDGCCEIVGTFRVHPDGKVLGGKAKISVIAVVKKSTDSLEMKQEDPDQIPLTQPDGNGGESPVPQEGDILPMPKAEKAKRGKKSKKEKVADDRSEDETRAEE
jgi:hypothetical protein